MSTTEQWNRYRFYTSEPSSSSWPPPGPCWCAGVNDDLYVIIACLPPSESLTEWWSDASVITIEKCAMAQPYIAYYHQWRSSHER